MSKKRDIIFKDPQDLTLHPLLKTQPALDKNSSTYISMLEDIRERGLDYPVLITEDNQVLDGRHRWLIAKQIQLEEIPCEVRNVKEASEIIVNELLQRRHYPTEGARIYCAAPLFTPLMASAEERRLANLRKGTVPNPIASASGMNLKALAARLQCSEDLLSQAVKLRKAFDKSPELQAQFEPKILAGEIGLGGCLAGIAGQESTKSKPKPQEDQLELFTEAFKTLDVRFKYWRKFDEDEKQAALNTLRSSIKNMPPDLRTELKKTLAAIEKEEKSNG